MAQPSPEIRQRLAQLKAEAQIRAERDAQRQKAAQNAEKVAQSSAPQKKSGGGSMVLPQQVEDMLVAPTTLEKAARVIQDTTRKGLDVMFPIRKVVRTGAEPSMEDWHYKTVMADPDASIQNQNITSSPANRFWFHHKNRILRGLGLPTIPDQTYVPLDDWQHNSFPSKAKGGSIPNQDVMRLAIGGQGPRNFLKGSVEKVINPLKVEGGMHPDQLREQQKLIEDASALGTPGLDFAIRQMKDEVERAKKPNAINDWIERNLGNYIRKQLGHPNDPLRKLAEEGVLHFNPDTAFEEDATAEQAESRRQMMGGQKMAKGPLAQAWENAVDSTFEPNTVEDVRNMPDIYQGMHEPWMDKVDPKTQLYELYGANELGFDHIVDILKQDLAEGRIRPEQLNKVSIEQAVRRVHEYDQERKKKMAETALKATEGMPVHKDYGDGFKWIELAMPDPGTEVPDTHELEQYSSKVHGTGYRYVDKQTGMKGEGYKTPERATEEFLRSQAEDKLDKALKYEGDTMGHCVGGYTPDVASGKSRIFSLRDEKNEPHVTVEVQPKNTYISDKKILDLMEQNYNVEGMSDEEYKALHGRLKKEALANQPLSIKQIKGKGNAKPKKDYIPYVQDFVKSGNWSSVGDLQNTELIKHEGKYMTPDEHSDWLLNQLKPDQMADGGEVDAEAVFMAKGGKIKELEQYLRDREGEYGLKRLQRATDEIPGLENMYTLQALKEAFGGDNAKALMTMDPADFEKFAEELGRFADENATKYTKSGERLPFNQYLDYLAKIQGGFSDVPYLEINKRKPEYLPNISGHEGRHRSRALTNKGVQKSLVRLLPSPSIRESMPRNYREDFIEAMKKKLGERYVVPETEHNKAVQLATLGDNKRAAKQIYLSTEGKPQLPEIYKDGGEVDAEDYFFPKSKE